jgi:threonine dehydratase
MDDRCAAYANEPFEILPMVTLRSIQEARERIRGSIVVTPFVHSENFRSRRETRFS